MPAARLVHHKPIRYVSAGDAADMQHEPDPLLLLSAVLVEAAMF